MQCVRCNKKSLFLRVNDEGLCKSCDAIVKKELEEARQAELERQRQHRLSELNKATEYYELLCEQFVPIADVYPYPNVNSTNLDLHALNEKYKACSILKDTLRKWDGLELFEEVYRKDCTPCEGYAYKLENKRFPLVTLREHLVYNFDEAINDFIYRLDNISFGLTNRIRDKEIEKSKAARGVTDHEFFVAGTNHYEKNIIKLGQKNNDYDMSKRDIIDCCMTDEKIYRYKFTPRTVDLIPEPTNEHDPNAIKVVVDGQHVGYIKAYDCSTIQEYLNNKRIDTVSVSIEGGPYKMVTSDYNENFKEVYTVERDADYYDITLHIEVI